jgi:hypothetical protein
MHMFNLKNIIELNLFYVASMQLIHITPTLAYVDINTCARTNFWLSSQLFIQLPMTIVFVPNLHFFTNRAPIPCHLSSTNNRLSIRSIYPMNFSSIPNSSHLWIFLACMWFCTVCGPWKQLALPMFHSHVSWHWEINCWEGNLAYSSR